MKANDFARKTMVFCSAINCSSNCNSDVSTYKFLRDKKKIQREWLESEWESFQPTKHSHVIRAEHFTTWSILQLGKLFVQ